MSTYEIETSTVLFPNGDLSIDAYLAQPTQSGSFPAVIVFQEIFGVNDHIRDVTERIAREGYVAIAPALYQRLAPGFEAGYTPEAIELGRAYKMQTKAEELLGDTQAAIRYLRSLPAVDGAAIGTIGFCFGGHVAYLAATLPDIKATASFYGAGIATATPGGGPPTLSRTGDITGTVYAFFGDRDASIPAAEVAQIQDALSAHRIPHQIFRYPADHGFFCDRRGSYQPDAAADAWQKALQLFQSALERQPQAGLP
ncbi:dienelactone hydrolase family protein [Altericista sp. CCNU0014]|uniref:dienelactone hydrolase family protein n=1 Tax=Altericista sp. CCNU0014 TaxID=3082949 RepID=UPI00384B9655